MRKHGVALALMLAVLAPAAGAEPPKTSPRPTPRPLLVAAVPPAAVAAVVAAPADALVAVVASPAMMGVTADLRPRPRPFDRVATAAVDPGTPLSQGAEIDAETVVELSAAPMPRPNPRPTVFSAGDSNSAAVIAEPERPAKKGWSLFKTAAVRNPQSPESLLPKKGSVCGDPAIRGQELAPVVSRVKGCGIDSPVEVTQIAGVRLSQPATVTCETALAAKSWIERGLQSAFAKDPVKVMHIAGSYVCRPRNGIRGNKVSEHGRGKALDISGFTLTSGKVLSVAGDYRRSKPIKAAHKAACGPFGTTLGPGSDGHHEDHLHFDVAQHRSGSYCR